MNATALLADLRARGVQLEPQGDSLRVVAPRGVLTAELQSLLTFRKADILAALRSAEGDAGDALTAESGARPQRPRQIRAPAN